MKRSLAWILALALALAFAAVSSAEEAPGMKEAREMVVNYGAYGAEADSRNS